MGPYQLRYIKNLDKPKDFEIIDSYPNYAMAAGMKKRKNANYPITYHLDHMKIVKV